MSEGQLSNQSRTSWYPIITASSYKVTVLVMSINYVIHQYTNPTQNTPRTTTQTPHKTSPGEGLQSLIAFLLVWKCFFLTCYLHSNWLLGNSKRVVYVFKSERNVQGWNSCHIVAVAMLHVVNKANSNFHHVKFAYFLFSSPVRRTESYSDTPGVSVSVKMLKFLVQVI